MTKCDIGQESRIRGTKYLGLALMAAMRHNFHQFRYCNRSGTAAQSCALKPRSVSWRESLRFRDHSICQLSNAAVPLDVSCLFIAQHHFNSLSYPCTTSPTPREFHQKVTERRGLLHIPIFPHQVKEKKKNHTPPSQLSWT